MSVERGGRVTVTADEKRVLRVSMYAHICGCVCSPALMVESRARGSKVQGGLFSFCVDYSEGAPTLLCTMSWLTKPLDPRWHL
jgi:hypothetical protein